MSISQVFKAKDYKSGIKPIWCPGCGHYSVLAAVSRALATLQADKDRTAVLSGIGCSSRLPAYLDTYGFHGVHGRVLPLATGLALSRPDLTVIAISGDGDGLSIGGNHFLHACRRNVNFLYVIMDNEVYGMTKGQASPTTHADWTRGRMTPEGTGLQPVQPALLALSAGANWIGRSYSGNPAEMADLMVRGLRYPGFAFLHVMSHCITYCPEQADWKHAVREQTDIPPKERSVALARLAGDDGLSTGLLFEAPVVAPAVADGRQDTQPADLRPLGWQFRVD